MNCFAGILLLLVPEMLPAQHLSIDDLLTSSSAQESGAGLLSPDGSTFANVKHGQVVLRPVGGGEARTLTTTSAAKSELSWSRDSQHLAFISEGDIWTASTRGGAATRVTHDPAGPGDPRGATDHHPLWHPHGEWILYQSGRKGFNELYAVRDDGSEQHLLAAAEVYTGTDAIPLPGHALNTVPDHGDAVASDRFDPNPSWSPDGKRIAYTERSRPFFSGKLNILSFDEKTGMARSPRTIYTAKNDKGGAWSINTSAWLPDSRSLVVVLQESGWDKLWLLPVAGGLPKPLTTGTGEDENPVVAPDGKSVVFTSNRDLAEECHLWIVTTSRGTPHRLSSLNGIEDNPQWTPDSRSIYFTRGTALESPVAYVKQVGVATPARALQRPGSSKFCVLGITPEVVHYPGGDGYPLAGILYKPANFDRTRRYPTVISAHGGPEDQTTLTLSPWSLFLADHGYVVLEPNFRGSTGYGERFRNSNVEDSGGGEIDDIAASVKYLIDVGITDPKRVAISGGSHGGTVVANAVAKLPDTFAAGVEMFGVVDRALFLQYTNRNSAIRWETKMGGPPSLKPTVYGKANVLLQVDAIKTPLLILHGEEDPQVPLQESQQFVAALKAAGKSYEYNTYPREGHGFQESDHRRDAYKRQLDFLNKYLVGAAK